MFTMDMKNFVKTFWPKILEILLHFGCSLYDIGSDVANAIGYFLGHSLNNNFDKCSDNHGNETICFDDEKGLTEKGKEQYDVALANHQEWGGIVIALIFLPGLFWACRPKTGSRNSRRFYGLIFPFYTIAYGFYALKKQNVANKRVQNRLLLICVFEACFESYPQIILAIYSLSFQDTTISTIQKFGILGSVFFVANAIISFDIGASDVELSSLVDYIKYILKVLPLYGFGTLFRVISLSLTIIYLRWFAIVPIFILLIEMVIIVGTCFQWDRDIIYHMALTNLNAANVGMIRIRYIHGHQPRVRSPSKVSAISITPKDTQYVNEDENIEKKCRRFLTISQYVTLFHHVIVLSIILYIIRSYRDNLDDLNKLLHLGSHSTIQKLEEVLQPQSKWHGLLEASLLNGVTSVYVIFCSVIMIGMIDVLVVSCMSRHVRFKNLERTDVEKDEENEKEIQDKPTLEKFTAEI